MERMKFIPLFSGSSGNALFLEAGETRVLIDAGLPAKTIEQALLSANVPPETLSAILVTHEHTDHIKGVGAMARRYRLPVYANAPTWEAMADKLGKLPPHDMRTFETGQDFYLRDLNILPFATPHDAAESVGYAFTYKGLRLCSATDVGHVDGALLDILAGSRLLFLEANHDEDMLRAGPYPYQLKRRILSEKGHLSNDSAGKALCRLYGRGVRDAILGHLSRENNYEELALATVKSALLMEDIPENAMRICVARRDRPTGVFYIG